jgi:hypothetical protein
MFQQDKNDQSLVEGWGKLQFQSKTVNKKESLTF